MRIIVHFGMPKTGSTSIEQTLYKSRDKLNICYPDLGSFAHNAHLSQAFREMLGVRSANTIFFAKKKELALSKLKKVLDLNSSEKDILLSSELLSNAFSINELKALHSVLVKYTKEVIAVGYIRTPKAYIESAFQQRLKTGKVSSFDLEPCFPYYQFFFEKFDQVFGAENVHFWKFDPINFPNGCVVTDFCQRLAIDIPPDSIVSVNQGISLDSIPLLYAYAKYQQNFKFNLPSEAKLTFSINVPSQHNKKLRFASEVITPILEKNRHHIEWMENRMSVSLAEDIYKNDQHSIHTETELLTFTPEATQWLAKKLGVSYVNRWHPKISAQEIAEWMHILRLRGGKKSKADQKNIENSSTTLLPAIRKKNKRINVKSLVQLVKKAEPNLENLSDENAVSLVREIFKQMTGYIENMDDAALMIAGLGQFKVSNISKSKGNKNITTKQVIFKAQKEKKTVT
ncbi:MAG: hypothetical protein Q7U57_18390 [Methylovulum sp.]|nr:hypothetical protein [Methylovulum sp.]